MKTYLLLLFLFCMLYNAQAQLNYYNLQRKFSGKAPKPWAIDGNRKDWETILGKYTGNNARPYDVPDNGSNWYYDQAGILDADNPDPKLDFRFFSYINDSYNVYFYFRLLNRPEHENSFFFFLDVNVDGVMSEGEPVIGASFQSKEITNLSLYRFTGARDSLMVCPSPDGYTIEANLKKLFNSKNIPRRYALKANEVFAAKVTERGMGVELAIPWRFLKNWYTNSPPLHNGDGFTYHLSLQKGNGIYRPKDVSDNGTTNNIEYPPFFNSFEVVVKKLHRETLIDKLSYRYYLSFQVSNVSVASINQIQFSNIPVNDQYNFIPDFKVTVYPDMNCNGEIDFGESFFDGFKYYGGSIYQQPITYMNPYGEYGSLGGKCSFIYITFSQYPWDSSYSNATVQIIPYIVDAYLPGPVFCDTFSHGGYYPPAGKTLTPISLSSGVTQLKVNKSEPVYEQSLTTRQDISADDVIIAPNPSNGNARVRLSGNSGKADVILSDGTGKILQRWNHVTTQVLPLQHLKPGFYLLSISYYDGRKKVVKKLIVQ